MSSRPSRFAIIKGKVKIWVELYNYLYQLRNSITDACIEEPNLVNAYRLECFKQSHPSKSQNHEQAWNLFETDHFHYHCAHEDVRPTIDEMIKKLFRALFYTAEEMIKSLGEKKFMTDRAKTLHAALMGAAFKLACGSIRDAGIEFNEANALIINGVEAEPTISEAIDEEDWETDTDGYNEVNSGSETEAKA